MHGNHCRIYLRPKYEPHFFLLIAIYSCTQYEDVCKNLTNLFAWLSPPFTFGNGASLFLFLYSPIHINLLLSLPISGSLFVLLCHFQ